MIQALLRPGEDNGLELADLVAEALRIAPPGALPLANGHDVMLRDD